MEAFLKVTSFLLTYISVVQIFKTSIVNISKIMEFQSES